MGIVIIKKDIAIISKDIVIMKKDIVIMKKDITIISIKAIPLDTDIMTVEIMILQLPSTIR